MGFCLWVLGITDAEAVGASIEGAVAAQDDFAAVDASLGCAGQEPNEVVADSGRCVAGLGRQGGEQQGIAAVQGSNLIGIATGQGAVPPIKQLRHLRFADWSAAIHGRGGRLSRRHQQRKPEQAGEEPAPAWQLAQSDHRERSGNGWWN